MSRSLPSGYRRHSEIGQGLESDAAKSHNIKPSPVQASRCIYVGSLIYLPSTTIIMSGHAIAFHRRLNSTPCSTPHWASLHGPSPMKSQELPDLPNSLTRLRLLKQHATRVYDELHRLMSLRRPFTSASLAAETLIYYGAVTQGPNGARACFDVFIVHRRHYKIDRSLT